MIFPGNLMIRGSFAIDPLCIKNGTVKTDDGDGGTTNTIRLSCLPKLGAGLWLVDGGDNNDPAALIVDAPLYAAGRVSVSADGTLEVNRPASFYQGLHVAIGGRVTVDRYVNLDAQRFILTPEGDSICPVPASP